MFVEALESQSNLKMFVAPRQYICCVFPPLLDPQSLGTCILHQQSTVLREAAAVRQSPGRLQTRSRAGQPVSQSSLLHGPVPPGNGKL